MPSTVHTIDLQIAVSGESSAQGRLSLSPVTPVPSADITGSTIYYHPVGGNLVPIWNGFEFKAQSFNGVLSLPLDSNTAHAGYAAAGYNYDLYALWLSGAVRLVHVASWAAGFVASPNLHKERATGADSVELEPLNGILVNKRALTARFGNGSGDIITMGARMGTYLGTFRATANGTTIDSYRQRLLYNVYNQAPRALKVAETTASWAYSAAAFGLMNASPNNQIEVLFGLEGNLVDLTFNVFASTSHGIRDCLAGIGVDSLVSPVDGSYSYQVVQQLKTPISARYCRSPGKGFSTLSILTYGAGAAGETQTWWEGSGAEGQVTL